METIQVVLDEGLLRAADRAVRRLKINRSALIRLALRRHLERLDVLEKERRDREGYRSRPARFDEYAGWDRVAAWPEE